MVGAEALNVNRARSIPCDWPQFSTANGRSRLYQVSGGVEHTSGDSKRVETLAMGRWLGDGWSMIHMCAVDWQTANIDQSLHQFKRMKQLEFQPPRPSRCFWSEL